MKNSNDRNVNRTRDISACSAVPQQTASLRTPVHYLTANIDISMILVEKLPNVRHSSVLLIIIVPGGY